MQKSIVFCAERIRQGLREKVVSTLGYDSGFAKRERKLTLTQCVVGGVCGFGFLVGLLCYGTGAGWGYWVVLTVFLTLVHTLYYYMSTK